MKTFYIQQKIQFAINRYKVFADDAGEQSDLVAFAEQKRFAFKEKMTIYKDESKESVLFEIKARTVIDLGARYDIRDESGQVLGVAGKAFGASLLRSTWHIFRPGQEDKPALIVKERSKTLAIVRRLWEFVPVVGDIPFFVKYHFDFVSSDTGQVEASYTKTTNFRDHYRLDIQDDAAEDIGWQVFVAMGIMLDALQSR